MLNLWIDSVNPSDSRSAHAKSDKHIRGELGSKDKTQPQREVHIQHAVEADKKLLLHAVICWVFRGYASKIHQFSLQVGCGVIEAAKSNGELVSALRG